MPGSPLDNLSRREREVIQIIYSLGEATAVEVQEKLEPPTKNAATRKILTSLLEKGAVIRRKVGKRFIYAPSEPVEDAASSILNQVIDTFFKGSHASALSTMVELGIDLFSEQELEQMRSIVRSKT